MEAKQLWLYFSIVLEGNQLDEGIITYQAHGICLRLPVRDVQVHLGFSTEKKNPYS